MELAAEHLSPFLRKIFQMADKSRLVYKAAKRYLDRQATGGKIGRFAVQRTLEHLKRCNVVLSEDVKQLRINLVDPVGKHNNGAHRFFWENFPQLKYKNPRVDFSRSGKKSLAEELLVKFEDGREERISTVEKNPSQIMQELTNVATMSSTRLESSVTDDDT